MFNYFLIAIGGALGALSRYGLFHFLSNFEHKHIRLGVFTVNIIGSFLIGIALAFAVKKIFFERGSIEHFIFVTGFLGAFTTFSTFSQDNIELLFLEKNTVGFFINILANVTFGVLACALGYFLIYKFILKS